MRVPLVGLVACAAAFPAWPGPAAARAGDGVTAAMRVEGTIPKPDSPLFDKNPYAKDRVPYALLRAFASAHGPERESGLCGPHAYAYEGAP